MSDPRSLLRLLLSTALLAGITLLGACAPQRTVQTTTTQQTTTTLIPPPASTTTTTHVQTYVP